MKRFIVKSQISVNATYRDGATRPTRAYIKRNILLETDHATMIDYLYLHGFDYICT